MLTNPFRQMMEFLIAVQYDDSNSFAMTLKKRKVGLSRIEVAHNAFTIFKFATDTDLPNNTQDSIINAIHNCIKNSMSMLQPENQSFSNSLFHHNNWHIDKSLKTDDHFHIVKDNAEQITFNQMICLLNQIININEEYRQENDKGIILDHQDKVKILDAYKDYIEKSKSFSIEKQNYVAQQYQKVEKQMISSAKSFIHAFLTELIQRYFVPLAIEKGLSNKQATIAAECSKFITTFILSYSLASAALDSAIRNGLAPILSKMGLNPVLVERALASIGTVVALTENPYHLVTMCLNSSAALSGQLAASLVIQGLGKWKQEAPDMQIVDSQVVSNGDNHSSLRRRI